MGRSEARRRGATLHHRATAPLPLRLPGHSSATGFFFRFDVCEAATERRLVIYWQYTEKKKEITLSVWVCHANIISQGSAEVNHEVGDDSKKSTICCYTRPLYPHHVGGTMC